MHFRGFLIAGGLIFALGACSSDQTIESEEEVKISKGVSVYHHNKAIVSIPGPFITKKEKNYTSFTKGEGSNPILYQMDHSGSVYIDCKKDKFDDNEFPITFGIENHVLKPEDLESTEKICKRIGY